MPLVTFSRLYFNFLPAHFLKWGTHLYMLIFLSVRLSIRLDVARHIKGNVDHPIIIFGIHCKMMISLGIFSFFENLIFWALSGVKAQKIVKNEK